MLVRYIYVKKDNLFSQKRSEYSYFPTVAFSHCRCRYRKDSEQTQTPPSSRPPTLAASFPPLSPEETASHQQEILLVRRHGLASHLCAFIGWRARQSQVSTCTLLLRPLVPARVPPGPPRGPLIISHPKNCDENSGTYTAAGSCQQCDTNYIKCVFKKAKVAPTSSSISCVLLLTKITF